MVPLQPCAIYAELLTSMPLTPKFELTQGKVVQYVANLINCLNLECHVTNVGGYFLGKLLGRYGRSRPKHVNEPIRNETNQTIVKKLDHCFLLAAATQFVGNRWTPSPYNSDKSLSCIIVFNTRSRHRGQGKVIRATSQQQQNLISINVNWIAQT